MNSYATGTSVSVENSQAEIRKILQRFGASDFGHAERQGMAVIAFTARKRMVKFVLTLPDRKLFLTDKKGFSRTENAVNRAWEQAVRERWRSLALGIKAKLVMVEDGIVSFENEFMSHIVVSTPGGPTTVGDLMQEQIAAAYDKGLVPLGLPMLPMLPALK